MNKINKHKIHFFSLSFFGFKIPIIIISILDIIDVGCIVALGVVGCMSLFAMYGGLDYIYKVSQEKKKNDIVQAKETIKLYELHLHFKELSIKRFLNMDLADPVPPIVSDSPIASINSDSSVPRVGPIAPKFRKRKASVDSGDSNPWDTWFPEAKFISNSGFIVCVQEGYFKTNYYNRWQIVCMSYTPDGIVNMNFANANTSNHDQINRLYLMGMGIDSEGRPFFIVGSSDAKIYGIFVCIESVKCGSTRPKTKFDKFYIKFWLPNKDKLRIDYIQPFLRIAGGVLLLSMATRGRMHLDFSVLEQSCHKIGDLLSSNSIVNSGVSQININSPKIVNYNSNFYKPINAFKGSYESIGGLKGVSNSNTLKESSFSRINIAKIAINIIQIQIGLAGGSLSFLSILVGIAVVGTSLVAYKYLIKP